MLRKRKQNIAQNLYMGCGDVGKRRRTKCLVKIFH
jgi:hypothetical protein